MNELTTAQRQHLRRLAHDRQPLVQIGKQGVTEKVLTNVDQALEANELIKVKYAGMEGERQALAGELARATRSHLVGVIGSVVILYRQQRDPERRQIEVP